MVFIVIEDKIQSFGREILNFYRDRPQELNSNCVATNTDIDH